MVASPMQTKPEVTGSVQAPSNKNVNSWIRADRGSRGGGE